METKITVHSQKGEGDSFANKHTPAEEKPAKPHLPESNVNKSKQELYWSQAKIFRWKTNPLIAN